MSEVVIEAFRPARPWAHPGASATVEAEVSAGRPTAAEATVSLVDLDREIGQVSAPLELGPATTTVRVEVPLPDATRHGYGLRLRIDDGATTVGATSAIEALQGWWESPRHAAITDYRSATSAAAATAELVGWHVNVVQHYDWMWRHYRYRPPDGAVEFVDALGRRVSHEAVRAAIEAGHGAGIASLAYGAVYGAETEYVDEHPDERVLDDAGEPLSLDGTFHINDLRPGTRWRTRLLDEYESAIRDFGFDGIHMDSYGPPHRGVAVDGTPIDFAVLYPGLIEEAAARVAAAAPGSRVLFNCVEGFPLETVAPAPTSCLYLELWPPDRTYADVIRWIDRARALADGRQVVIAAYAATLKGEETVADRAAAFEAVPLLGSLITAAGAYHHTIAERDRVLVEGYYPAAVELLPLETEQLRALWCFTARYVHLLSDPSLQVVDTAGLDIHDAHGRSVPWSTEPTAGAIWVRATRIGGAVRVLHLVDLREHGDACWDGPKLPAAETTDLRLLWAGAGPAAAASPWTSAGEAVRLSPGAGGWSLPAFRRWLMVVWT